VRVSGFVSRLVVLAGMLVASASPALAVSLDESDALGESASISVVHAIPAEGGFPADVYLDGERVVEAFVYLTSTDVVPVPAGSVDLAVYPAGGDPSTDPVASTTVDLEPAGSYTVVASVPDGEPQLALYQNEIGPLGAGKSRLVVRNVSSIEAVSVSIGPGTLVLEADQETTSVVAAGTVDLGFTADDGATLAEGAVDLAAGRVTIVYLVGGNGQPSSLLQQVLPVDQAPPSAIPSGSGGQKAAAGVAVLLGRSLAVAMLVAIGFVRNRGVSGETSVAR
jgi:hypothetical protein